MDKIITVITGVGMVTSLGVNAKQTFDNMVNAKSGVKKITLFDPQNLHTHIAAQVSDDFEDMAINVIKKRDAKKMTRLTRMAMLATNEAIIDSMINFDECDKNKTAVIMGVITSAYNDMERKLSDDNLIVKSMSNSLSAWISMKYKLLGPNFGVSTACASSAYAIHLAREMIERKQADVVIVGGADSHINEECIYGFNQIMALSTKNERPEAACRPFDKGRDGFVMGEGAGILVLESKEHAEKRNAKIYAEVAGSSITSEAHDITAPQKNGIGMSYTMKEALKSACIAKEEVDYINAHGTSTYLNDLYETMAIKDCFGDHAYNLKISSSKSMLGHTLGAAGVIESIVCALSMHSGILTPTINYETQDDNMDLDYIANNSLTCQTNIAISNSFGFGGHNASIVYRKI